MTFKSTLIDTLQQAMSGRFEDISKDVVGATKIANFKVWPSSHKKEEIKGMPTNISDQVYPFQYLKNNELCQFFKVMDKLYMTFLLLEFGYEQMSTLVGTTLEKAGVNGEAALREWSTLKGILYGRYVGIVHQWMTTKFA